ncbi:MAG: phosphatase PAP2 family protein [Ktedonobacteraceae bacterium]
MSSTTHPEGIQRPTDSTTASGEDRQAARKRHRFEAVFWILGLIVFIIACVTIHLHPQPYPVDLSTTEAVQQANTPAPILDVVNFPSLLNNPIPSAVALLLWTIGLLLIGLIARLRRSAAVLWIMSAIFLAIAVMSSTGLNVLSDEIVGRPRPNPRAEPIHMYTALVPFPSFPSGHTEHDIVFYGFLLYLSFTKRVREWRYHWWLLPFQLYAVYDIIAIGYSRIYLGDHWLTDVLGGYLEGAVYLFFFIFLYRWATGVIVNWLDKRRSQKVQSYAAR